MPSEYEPHHTYMDKLYPIIRRVRRPLIQENPETLKPVVSDSQPVAPEKPKADDAESISHDAAE
jgi:hypothetical protein